MKIKEAKTSIEKLEDFGQSVWLDYIQRSMTVSTSCIDIECELDELVSKQLCLVFILLLIYPLF